MAKGQSFALCLPKRIVTNLTIAHGDVVKVYQEERRIVIEKVNE